jgi:TRAP-type C4-dicarboxylate transport system substrate-binding protein
MHICPVEDIQANVRWPMKTTLVAILVLYLSSADAEQVTLTLASSWNRQQNFTTLFMKYIDSVNEAGRGIVQIKFLGGPEVIPQRQLFYALRRGVIDMAFGGITYYRGVLPEGDAIFASTITPMQARSAGALDSLQPYWEKRINARLIGWMQSGVGVNIYLIDPPRFDKTGMPDLSGLKLRTSPSNREILTALGGRAVQIPVKEIYTSLQRGTVDGLAFTTTGMPDLGIDRFIHYRIDPAFLQLAICLQMNLDRWNELSPQARNILEAQAAIYERESRQAFFALQDAELEFLKEQGLRSAPVPDGYADAYRSLAHEVVWERLARRQPDSAAHLKPIFYPDKGRLGSEVE